MGMQSRELLTDEHFLNLMSDIEKIAWLSFTSVCKNFQGTHKTGNYLKIFT